MTILGRGALVRAAVRLPSASRRCLSQNSRGRTIIRDPRKTKCAAHATKDQAPGLIPKKRPPPPSRAVEEIPEQQHVPPSKYQPFFNFQEAPKQSFKSSMAQSLTWGFGMTLAFIAVASVFS